MLHLSPSGDSSYVGEDAPVVLNANRAIIKEKVFLSIDIDNNISLP
jgi:hypothetical protein